MSTTLAPFGLRPAYHPSGTVRPRAYKVVDATQAAYATALFSGAPVALVTDGSIAVAASTAAWLGVFAGCEYTDANGKPVKAPNLPASQTGITNVVMYVYDDPHMVFEVQCSTTAVANTAVGDQLLGYDVGSYTASSGNTRSGTSTFAFTGTLSGAGVQGNAVIIGIGQQVDNAFGDAYTIVQVRNSRQQLGSVFVAV